MIAQQLQPYAHPEPKRDKRTAQLDNLFLDVLTFIISFVSFIEINLIGRLFASELLLLILLPVLLFYRGHVLKSRFVSRIIALGVAWFIAQVITDLIRGTPFGDYTRGWSKIAFTLANFVGMVLLLHGRGRKPILLFGLGLGLGILLSVVIHKASDPIDLVWKMNPGHAVTLIVCVILSSGLVSRVPKLVPIGLILLACVHVIQGARALSGFCFAAAVLLYTRSVLESKGISLQTVSRRVQILAAIVLVVASSALINIYSTVASSGYLGKEARNKYIDQSESKYGLLLGGRSESLVTTQAILDSPIIGHGSWARDRHYVKLYIRLLEQTKKPGEHIDREGFLKSGLIPSHSHFFGAWVEAGIFGALFWLYVFITSFNVVRQCLALKDPLIPLLVYLALSMMFDIPFSPFGADRRITVAFTLVVLMYFNSQYQAYLSAAREGGGLQLSPGVINRVKLDDTSVAE